MDKSLRLRLYEIQPTQLYINARKLAFLEEKYPPGTEANIEPVPVKMMHGKIVYTDGHTRAFILWKRGYESIDAVWDDTYLDETTYETCLGWCESEEIFTIADLADRIVDDATFQTKWIARCQAIDSDRVKAR
ncbi:MAG TPA: hypothetical protein VKM55_13675 [Candidatus Lokiarchaeia archaeon]|nr:hypothetical protein [Candidatus Lokiarchaeia archaeon]